MSKRSYQNKIGRAYNQGRVKALLMVGKTIPEIVELLGLKESTVRNLSKVKI